MTEQQWRALDKLAKVAPFNKPNIVDHIVSNPDPWQQYLFAKDSENIQMPGPYNDYDPEKEAKLAKQKKSKAKSGLKAIQEEQEDEAAGEDTNPNASKQLDERIWGLDEDDENDSRHGKDNDSQQASEDDNAQEKFQDEREQIADSLVMGVSDYQEFRLGSIRFEKEMQTKKQQVLKDLLRFCLIRIFRPERIVREV